MGEPTHRWFDSHCHLQDRYLPEGAQADASGVARVAAQGEDQRVGHALAACRKEGVERLVCVGTDTSSSMEAISLAQSRHRGVFGDDVPDIWTTVGIHPHDSADGDVEEVDAILASHAAALVDENRIVVAVGECGLDYHYDHSPREDQRQAFAAQIQLAHRYGLALVIHARQAWDDLFEILMAEGVPSRTVVHCFTGGPDEARKSLDLGMMLSFSGIVTFKNAADVRAAAALCPLDRLLVETDSPFLAPVPHRGRPNQPAYVPLVGAAVAAAKGLDPQVVALSSWQAASELFAL